MSVTYFRDFLVDVGYGSVRLNLDEGNDGIGTPALLILAGFFREIKRD